MNGGCPSCPCPPAKILAGQDEQARQRRLSGEKLPPPAHGSLELKRIVLKACAYDPKNRYHTADEMLEELEALGSGDSKDDRTAGVYTAYADTKDETVGTQGIFGTAKTSGTASTAKAKKRQNPDSTKKRIIKIPPSCVCGRAAGLHYSRRIRLFSLLVWP